MSKSKWRKHNFTQQQFEFDLIFFHSSRNLQARREEESWIFAGEAKTHGGVDQEVDLDEEKVDHACFTSTYTLRDVY